MALYSGVRIRRGGWTVYDMRGCGATGESVRYPRVVYLEVIGPPTDVRR